MKQRLFETENGPMAFELKTYDGSLVPIGYFYESDIHERLKIFQTQLMESVFPIIERLVEVEIPKYFYLEEGSIDILVFGTQLRSNIEQKSIKNVFQQVISNMEFLNDYNIELYFNLAFTAKHDGKLKSYGCQIKIIVGDITVQDSRNENEYSVWYLYLGSEETIIEKQFTIEQENKIIGYYLGYLWQSEE